LNVRARLSTAVVTIGVLAGALSGAPAGAVSGPDPVGGKRPVTRSGHTARPVEPVGPLTVADVSAIANRWGIRIDTLRLTAGGYMLDFRYYVLDARKADPLFVRKVKPVLKDEASGLEVAVPVPPKTGALRSSNDPKAGREYFMFFANPARFIKAGNTVTVTIGAFSVGGIRVQADADADPGSGEARE
jgi:hypothetical protein